MMQTPEKYKKKIGQLQAKVDNLQGLTAELVELQFGTDRYLRDLSEGTLRQIKTVDRILELIKKRVL